MLPAREQGRAGKNQKSVMKCQRWWLYSFCVNGALLLVGSPNCWCLSSFSVSETHSSLKKGIATSVLMISSRFFVGLCVVLTRLDSRRRSHWVWRALAPCATSHHPEIDLP